MDTKYSKAFWLGRNLNILAVRTQGKGYAASDKTMAQIDHFVQLFSKSLNIQPPAIPDLTTGDGPGPGIQQVRDSTRFDLALVQSEFVAKCFLFGFDYSSWVNVRGGYDWDDDATSGLNHDAIESNLHRQAKELGLEGEMESCLVAAKDKFMSSEQFNQFGGSELLLRIARKLDQIGPQTLGAIGAGVSKELFIVMPMIATDPALEDVVDAIKDAAAKVGFWAYRVDQLDTSGRITDSIINGLKTAGSVVVDLTHARPNVYWEAGFCHGLGKLPIYVARSGTNIEFDVKDYPVIYYANMKQLREGLEKRLAKQM